MRQRNKKWVDGEMQTNEHLLTNGKENKGKWKEVFGNDYPVHLEIGCGKGDFVIGMSKVNKEINFVAFEKELQVTAMAIRKLREEEEELGEKLNVLFINADASNLNDYFEQGEIERIYVNFSDPWRNRKKWFKRRLTHRSFLEIYKGLLVEHGSVHQKTDNRDLFEFSLNEFSYADYKLSNISLDLHNSEYEGNIVTEYERKFSEKGFPIYRLEATKRS